MQIFDESFIPKSLFFTEIRQKNKTKINKNNNYSLLRISRFIYQIFRKLRIENLKMTLSI